MFKPSFIKFIIIAAITMLCIASQGSALTIYNGDFSYGLDGWMTFADPEPYVPFVRDGVVVFPENTWTDWDQRSVLIQEFWNVAPRMYRIELDLSMQTLGFETFGGTINGSDLFLMSQSGPYFVNGTLKPSALGSDWYHYQGDFFLEAGYGDLFFSFMNYDGYQDGSEAWLDNVRISNIPEPCTALLLSLGFIAFSASRCCRRKKH